MKEIFFKGIEKGWVMVTELAKLLSVTMFAIQKGIYRGKYTKVRQVDGVGRGGKIWQISIEDPAIPERIKKEYYKLFIPISEPSSDNRKQEFAPTGGTAVSDNNIRQSLFVDVNGDTVDTATGEIIFEGGRVLSDKEIDNEIYSSAPEYQRSRADKYLQIIRASEELIGEELKRFISGWNQENPEFRTSYPRLIDARNQYRESGISGILSKYGKSAGKTIVKDEWHELFKSLYLTEGRASLESSWRKVFGYAVKKETDPCLKPAGAGISLENFPSPITFLRRLEREIPESSIYLSRYGEQAWNRKYGNYLDRDYSNILSGECYVSDHSQVDVAVILKNSKIVFPWITVFRDFKSGKWLGWVHHPESPNSDHIFQAFYYAVKDWGLPTDIIIDNGKDYRCKDFAGNRQYFQRVEVNKNSTITMLALLKITPHFALPYNPQSKPIERDFLKNKEWFSKQMPGYRGGNVKERPEKLKDEIKRGDILTWDEYKERMDGFISDILNKTPSNGKVLMGRCPNELWEKEHKEKRVISLDALKLFCMRTSNDLTIGRNGVRDSEMGCFYWGEWMAGMKGTKVYLRRDVKVYQEAWVFKADTHEFIEKAQIAELSPALARNDIERVKVRELIASKARVKKIEKSFVETKDKPTPQEMLMYGAAGVEAINKYRGYNPDERKGVKVKRLANTAMDKVVLKARQMEEVGRVDIFSIQSLGVKKERIFQFECDKEEYEREMAELKQKEGNL
ncbi:MAG: transposase family protein [Nitrospinae bacterium]|nr:transposase family protein [Nitrospinota bacterium]